jgi:predicted enzyme related to lactoylglutathione lyase
MQTGKLVFVEIRANDVHKAADFFGKRLGLELAPSLTDQVESYHAPLTDDGVQIVINKRFSPNDSARVYLAVDDLNAALTEVKQDGGKVLVQPFQLPIAAGALQDYKAKYQAKHGAVPANTLGTCAVVQDSDGNSLGLIQLEVHAKAFYKNAGKPLDKEVVAEHKQAVTIGKQHQHVHV